MVAETTDETEKTGSVEDDGKGGGHKKTALVATAVVVLIVASIAAFFLFRPSEGAMTPGEFHGEADQTEPSTSEGTMGLTPGKSHGRTDHTEPGTSGQHPEKTGHEGSCQKDQRAVLKGTLEGTLQPSANPCQDFYSFVCGNYDNPSGQTLIQMQDHMYETLSQRLANASISPGSHSAADKAAELYRDCTLVRKGNIDETVTLFEFVKSIGLTADSFDRGEALDKILTLFFSYDIDTILGLSLEDTQLTRGKRELKLGLSDTQVMWFQQRGKIDNDKFYPMHLVAFGLPAADERAILKSAQRIIEAENTAVGLLTQDILEGRSEFAFATVRELDTHTPSMPPNRWEQLVSSHSRGVYGGDDAVQANPKALAYFDGLYANLGDEGLSLLTAWELLRTVTPLVSPQVAQMYEGAYGQSQCLKATMRAMEVPLLSWYLFKEVSPCELKEAAALSRRMRDTITKEINESTWLGGGTKKAAVEKIQTMGLHVGYPKYFESTKEIDQAYSSYPDAQGGFLTPWLSAMSKTTEWRVDNHSSFSYSVDSTNAFYAPMRNKIVIPATVLLPPLFAPGAPASLTYGGLAAVLGHEMTHAFDVKGSAWDAQGRFRNWWSPQSRQEYGERMACLRASHGVDENEQQDGENTADFGGLVSAFNAYSSLGDTEQLDGFDYDAQQLFFIASCVKWCATGEIKQTSAYASFPKRCNVPLQNMPEFARAFKCPEASPMNPVSRCSFW